MITRNKYGAYFITILFLLFGARQYIFGIKTEGYIPQNFLSFDMYRISLSEVKVYIINKGNEEMEITNFFNQHKWHGQDDLLANAINIPWDKGIRRFACNPKWNGGYDPKEVRIKAKQIIKGNSIPYLYKLNC